MVSRTLEFACGLILVVLLAGCAGSATGRVSLRPDGTPRPEKCPEEALKAMRYLRLGVGDGATAELDANQMDARPITLYEGRVESVLLDDLGTLESPTRLYGYVWTSGPQAVIRYYEALPPGAAQRVPICAVARTGKNQLRKRPESLPGTAVLEFSFGGVFIVDEFL
ncbi:serine/threonine protein kinase [Corallococcus carmarthensis]|uniref:serine/threonine protein kinase n=1 Tax=Corallococcus carmarthensis TaxID=2316728 RepID=UPI00148CED51|nr:serine/threonine protein kinase [Corallococcus carmarthensis]NOK16366.1 serine/threonine protein kinase [Corallococcus carmarthensis]